MAKMTKCRKSPFKYESHEWTTIFNFHAPHDKYEINTLERCKYCGTLRFNNNNTVKSFYIKGDFI